MLYASNRQKKKKQALALHFEIINTSRKLKFGQEVETTNYQKSSLHLCSLPTRAETSQTKRQHQTLELISLGQPIA